jgi:hypothetical protein
MAAMAFTQARGSSSSVSYSRVSLRPSAPSSLTSPAKHPATVQAKLPVAGPSNSVPSFRGLSDDSQTILTSGVPPTFQNNGGGLFPPLNKKRRRDAIESDTAAQLSGDLFGDTPISMFVCRSNLVFL